MKNGPLIFLGILLAVALSWAGTIYANWHGISGLHGYGSLTPYADPNDGQFYPQQIPGMAERGALVYQDLNCAACHTQEVRHAGLGGDIARGWGKRQSVARDYLREYPVMLGASRIGPDLTNVGARRTDAAALYLHLYDPQFATPGSLMPPSPFLFNVRRITGQAAGDALALPAGYRRAHGIPDGFEVVPTPRARALVAYLMNLKATYDYPEAGYTTHGAKSGTEEAK